MNSSLFSMRAKDTFSSHFPINACVCGIWGCCRFSCYNDTQKNKSLVSDLLVYTLGVACNLGVVQS